MSPRWQPASFVSHSNQGLTPPARPNTMSPDEHALLRAVAAAPADDLPRLVLADWLDENGQPLRAEFIRLQCRIAQLQGAEVYRHVPLYKRQQELLDDHMTELLEPHSGSLMEYPPRFARGLLSELTFSAWEYLSEGTAVACLLPPPAVTLTGFAVDGYQFGSHPNREALALVVRIEMQLKGTRETYEWDPEAMSLLGRMSDWPQLHTLLMEGCRTTDEGVRRLAAMPPPALTDLDLSQNDLTDAGVVALLDSGLLGRLRRLILGGNPLTDQSAFELADRLGDSTTLEHLNLRFTNIGPAGQQAILARFGGRVDLF